MIEVFNKNGEVGWSVSGTYNDGGIYLDGCSDVSEEDFLKELHDAISDDFEDGYGLPKIKREMFNCFKIENTVGKVLRTEFSAVYNYKSGKLESFTYTGPVPKGFMGKYILSEAESINITEKFNGFDLFEMNDDGAYDFEGTIGMDSYGTSFFDVEGTYFPDTGSICIENSDIDIQSSVKAAIKKKARNELKQDI